MLTNRTWSDAPVIIDGANVAGDVRLPGCGQFCWDRVDAIKEAWKDQVDPVSTFVVFMDTRTGHRLGSSCKREYRRERDSNQVVEVEFADPEILLLAERTDGAVISRDFFKDARREHPWLDGNQTQFFTWIVEHGNVMVVSRDMGTPSDFSKTRAEERSELKGKGVDISRPAIERALLLSYRCDTDTCWLHKYDSGHYTGVPDLEDPNNPRCCACHQTLTVLGDAPRLVQVKFSDSKHSTIERRTIPPDTTMVIGRDASSDLVARVLNAERELISRQHAKLDWDGSTLSLTDLGSRNGTTVRRWTGRQTGFAPTVQVHGTVSLGARDEACLAGVLHITRSARTFTLEPDPVPIRQTAASPATVPQDLRNG